jgi:uncharacterized protein YjbI with pentapeptide repeats
MFSNLKKIPRPVTIGLICFFSVVLVGSILPPLFGSILPPLLWPGGIGIGKDSPVSTKTTETDAQGKTVKTIETIKYDDGKTVWDWLSLLGVPLSLAILGYVLKEQQRKQEQQRKRADNETKEEVLQTYFDRLSVLLIDRNLIVLSNRSNSRNITPEEQELLDSALHIIRARTLSILRRFENDAERKTSVINFLIETEIIGKSKLNLSWANLEGAYLFRANLEGAKLAGANLKEANLQEAYLEGAYLFLANLVGANLYWANLEGANLGRANLVGANLIGANLVGANLVGADLSGAAKLAGADLAGADLRGADLEGADLGRANLNGADLRGAGLGRANLNGARLFEASLVGAYLLGAKLQGSNLENIKWDSKTKWPDKSAFANAENIPEELKKELGITP